MKRVLKKKYQEYGHNTKNLDKEIIFYCDWKPISNEIEPIGSIADGA